MIRMIAGNIKRIITSSGFYVCTAVIFLLCITSTIGYDAKTGDSIETIFKDAEEIKEDGSIYEVTYKGKKFFISNNLEYIPIVEPQVTGEWNFDTSTQILTKYNKDIGTKRGNQEAGEVIIPNYYNGKRVKGKTGMNQAYYEEHYKIIIKEDAVNKLSRL